MSLRLSLPIAIGAIVCSLLFLVLPHLAFAEEMVSFDADIALRQDSSFVVTEMIVYDFGSESRHGIFRIIPTSHPQSASAWYKERYVDIEVTGVQMDGGSVPYELTTPGDTIKIKIGDPNNTITGAHTYVISYVVHGALMYGVPPKETEIYWNVTGNEWQVSIGGARVTLTAPRELFMDAHFCYVGASGSTEGCSVEATENSIVFSSRALSPGEGVTIAQAINPNAVEVEVLERFKTFWFWIVGILLLLIGVPFFIYKIKTKHKVDLPVIAQYEPYEGVEPMYSGMLIDNRLDPKDITAGIVYLAEQGYLKITKIEKKFLFFDMSDYKVTLLKASDNMLGMFLPQILSLLFGENTQQGTEVTLSEIKNNLSQQALNQSILRSLNSALKEDMQSKGFLEPLFGSFPLWTRRTRKGYEAQNHLKGFKEFLSVTDKDRFDFHNAPEKSPEQFLKYLPYAIAFGVEEKWAAVFKDITIPNPGWYEGGNAGAFSAVAFSSDMSSFSSSLGGASGSGGSASGGGGFSGGGGGGGGGGSW